MSDQVITLEKVNKWYDDFHVLKDIDLIVNKGQKIVICGPSGSGKSTMIRCINRLEAHQEGKILSEIMEEITFAVEEEPFCPNGSVKTDGASIIKLKLL